MPSTDHNFAKLCPYTHSEKVGKVPTMPKYLAVVLAAATLALIGGLYMMAPSMGPFDMNKAANQEVQRADRLENPKPRGLFAMFKDKVDRKLEIARNQYLGEHLPETPDGWAIAKTNHDEIVDFTVDYKLKLTINDKSSVRRLAGWGGTTLARATDVKYVKGDKIIFVRLVGRQKTSETALTTAQARLFHGAVQRSYTTDTMGLSWEGYAYENVGLINIAAITGHDTAIGIFTNASLADVNALLRGMDIVAFGAVRGLGDNGQPAPKADNPYINLAELNADGSSIGPDTNLVEGIASADDGAAVGETGATSPRNLLDTLLSNSGSDKPSQPEVNRRKSSGGGSFQNKAGSFSSNCKSGAGAKFCSVGAGN